MLTDDDSKTGGESGWYEAITERDTAQHPHVRKSSLLMYMFNIARSVEPWQGCSHASPPEQTSSEVRSVECVGRALSKAASLDRGSGLQPL